MMIFLPTDDPIRKERLVAALCAVPQHILVSTWAGFLAHETEAAAARCRVPLLYIGGVFPADLARFKELCPQLVVGQTVGAGHFQQLEVPEQVNAMIDRFLAVSVASSLVTGRGIILPGRGNELG
jgi:pimeloyl-ACP methyl ester carboxylesterase